MDTDWEMIWIINYIALCGMQLLTHALTSTVINNFKPILKLTHWGRVMHICVGNLTIIASDNGLSPGRRQAITWTNVGILLIGPLGTNFVEMLIEIHTFSFKKIHLKMSPGKWRPFGLGLNVLKHGWLINYMYPIVLHGCNYGVHADAGLINLC